MARPYWVKSCKCFYYIEGIWKAFDGLNLEGAFCGPFLDGHSFGDLSAMISVCMLSYKTTEVHWIPLDPTCDKISRPIE
jgi:hypothetical protein